MPYKIVKRGSGYKVCKKTGSKCFSKKPLSKKKANAQRAAIAINTRESTNYFIQLIESTLRDDLQTTDL
jgi:hypothetical protein